MSLAHMLRLDPKTTAAVAIDMHRGDLDPAVATLPLPAARCGPVIKRAADPARPGGTQPQRGKRARAAWSGDPCRACCVGPAARDERGDR